MNFKPFGGLGGGGVSAGVIEGKEFLAGTAGKVYLVPAVGPFVARGLAGVVDADDLLAFPQALEVPVGGGDPDGRAFAGGPLMNLEGSEGTPGGPDDLEDNFPLPGRSLHSG